MISSAAPSTTRTTLHLYLTVNLALEKCKKNRQEQNENMKFELAKTP